MKKLSFEDLKNDLRTVALENRLELVQITSEATSYRCKDILDPPPFGVDDF